MINHRNGGVRPPHPSPRYPQTLERLRRRDLMHKMPVDIENARTVPQPLDNMRIPDLVKQRARHWWGLSEVKVK